MFRFERDKREESELKELFEAEREILSVLRHIESAQVGRITGGKLRQIGETMLSITPGNTPKFQVTPTFAGNPFAPVAANASVVSSDPANFPVVLDTTDATGLTFDAPIPAGATPTGGSEEITVTWTYTNTDGTLGVVTGIVTESGLLVPPPVPGTITGGTFAQVV